MTIFFYVNTTHVGVNILYTEIIEYGTALFNKHELQSWST